jgi:hypothetical protein
MVERPEITCRLLKDLHDEVTKRDAHGFSKIGYAVSLVLLLGIVGCGGGQSNPAPVINSISPSTANVGTQSQSVTINGSGFLANSTATYNGTGAQTTFGSSSQVTISLTASDLATVGAFPIVVTNPAPGGGPSNTVNFIVATNSALAELIARANGNQNFFVYVDQDSGFNHGVPSGFFAQPLSNLSTIHLDTGCVDDPADTTTGCFPPTDTTHLDTKRGTVMRMTFDAQTGQNFAGINIEEPLDFGVLQTGSGYDLTGAQNIVFDLRSPDVASVQFGVGQCVFPNFTQNISQQWTTVTFPLSKLVSPSFPPEPCPPALGGVHILFTVVTNGQFAPNGATVLLDNIQFTPAPSRSSQPAETFSVPLSTQTFGVVPQTAMPFPSDQVNRNIAAIYESALTMLDLLQPGGDSTSAQRVANALDYALYHDNQGDFIPATTNGLTGCFSGSVATQCGLHNAYESGDIGLLNAQGTGSGTAQAGNSRLSGFTCGPPPSTPFCLVSDDATGGNNAWAMLALLAEYNNTGNTTYLNDAITIGNWIVANLADNTGTGYGGYYAGYFGFDTNMHGVLNLGKSTENNADIFAAFSAMAVVQTQLGNQSAANNWANLANAAGDFVMQMFDSTNGRFNAGTVPVGTAPSPGICPNGTQKGNDVINVCDFLDSDTFTTLAMAGSPRYKAQIDWRRPIQYVLNTFAQQNITAGGKTYQGFNIVKTPVSGVNGIAWEFTGQAVETMIYVDQLFGQTTFAPQISLYLAQIQQAQASAPFGDGQGLVAATLVNGDALPPAQQCLNTPFQCIPERVGLAATAWAILAQQGINPLGSL